MYDYKSGFAPVSSTYEMKHIFINLIIVYDSGMCRKYYF